jgi:hypothetical protein
MTAFNQLTQQQYINLETFRKSGMVRFVHYGHAMFDIPKNAELLALLDRLNR